MLWVQSFFSEWWKSTFEINQPMKKQRLFMAKNTECNTSSKYKNKSSFNRVYKKDMGK